MKETICEEILCKRRENKFSETLIQHLKRYRCKFFNNYRFYYGWSSELDLERCICYHDYSKVFCIDFQDKKIVVYNKKFYKCMLDWGNSNNFKTIVKCWEQLEYEE